MNHDWTYIAELENIVDGDTLDFTVDLGFGTYKKIRVRLYGVDTNETYGVKKESEEYALGKAQAKFVQEWFESRDNITIETIKDSKGKYGRYLARVHGDGDNLRDDLIEEWPHVEASY